MPFESRQKTFGADFAHAGPLLPKTETSATASHELRDFIIIYSFLRYAARTCRSCRPGPLHSEIPLDPKLPAALLPAELHGPRGSHERPSARCIARIDNGDAEPEPPSPCRRPISARSKPRAPATLPRQTQRPDQTAERAAHHSIVVDDEHGPRGLSVRLHHTRRAAVVSPMIFVN